MNFGFAPSNNVILNPYFYSTAYPMPDGLVSTALPAEASWHTDSFTGALMMYEALVDAGDPAEKLLEFLRTVQQTGASLMKELHRKGSLTLICIEGRDVFTDTPDSLAR
jgi:hypothetical protein